MGDDVKSIVIRMKEFCLTFKRVKRVNDPRKCPFYFHILVLEALTAAEQDSLRQRVMPSESRAGEICKALNVNMTTYNEAIEAYFCRLPVESDDENMSLDGEEHWKMIENLGKKRKKRAKE